MKRLLVLGLLFTGGLQLAAQHEDPRNDTKIHEDYEFNTERTDCASTLLAARGQR